MSIEDIITSLEKYIHKVNPKAILVVQREVEPCRLRVFKTIRYTLWVVDNTRNKKYKLITTERVLKIDSPEAEKAATRIVEMEFMSTLFEYVRSQKFDYVLGGSYEGDEQILD